MAMSVDDEIEVKRRWVFYIPGFDPNPPRRYRELYRTEGARQAEISRYGLNVSARTGEGFGWDVHGKIEGVPVHARMDVLVWHDLVQASMGHSITATYWQLLRTAWIYIASGTMRRLIWLRKGPIVAAFYPIVVLLAQLALAMALGSVLAGVTATVVGWGLNGAAWALGIDALPGTALALWGLGWAVFAVTVFFALRFFQRWDGKLFAWYLMHDFAFAAGHSGAYPPELEERIGQFADQVARAMASSADEVLIVGHSSGAQLAVSVVADLLRSGRVPANGPELSLLTLGQAIPMVSFLPKAARLRRDLRDLAVNDRIVWVDVSAPGDGCSFALCDPVAVTGVAPEGARWPLVISAAFSKTLAPERWRALKRRYYRLHFQYLCAFDDPQSFDYFRITAGPRTLGARFADRKPSQNRIDVPASRFTDIAA
ncbi:MAG: hypothetical protein AAGJ74_10165 [Pseudomonadota bacterium]